jgi:hypothetical protein
MDNWRFFQDALSLWAWQHTAPDGAVRVSAHSFSSRTDCIADAMRHGYLAFDEGTQTAAPAPPVRAVPDSRSEPGPKPRDPADSH